MKSNWFPTLSSLQRKTKSENQTNADLIDFKTMVCMTGSVSVKTFVLQTLKFSNFRFSGYFESAIFLLVQFKDIQKFQQI